MLDVPLAVAGVLLKRLPEAEEEEEEAVVVVVAVMVLEAVEA